MDNIGSTHAVFEAATEAGCPRVVFSSTAFTYGKSLKIGEREREREREIDGHPHSVGLIFAAFAELHVH